jgi:alkylhydroperoxidase family enzyme
LPRLRQVPKDEATAPIVTTMYEWLFEGRDPVSSPGTWTGARRLDPVLRELGQIRAGWAAGSQFVFSQHCKSLRDLGVDEDKIQSIPFWSTADCYDDLERHVLAYADCLVLEHGRVADDLFASLQERLSDEEILELTYITTMYFQHAVMSRALRTEFDDRDDPVFEVPGPQGASALHPGASDDLTR